MRRILQILFLLCLSSSIFAGTPRQPLPNEQCSAFVPYGQPASPHDRTLQLICREGYFLLHDNIAKIPVWVAYTLTANKATGCNPRAGTFKPEPGISAGSRSEMRDYAHSGYDIGHMANDGDMRWTPQVEIESNVLSNAAPQLPGLNRAGWKMLEDQTRAWAISRGRTILIYVGPIYDHLDSVTIGQDHVTVPSAFYKILVDETTHEVLSFIYPHKATSASPGTFLTTFLEVEHQTGVVFGLPIDATFSTKLWPITTKSGSHQRSLQCAIH